jgi:MFS superfamily sulfate permease-like transporter
MANQPRERSILLVIFPFFRWFKYTSRQQLRADFISGLTVALVLIPQSMAYAQLAGLPPYYGLYASLLPPLIASLFGSSNQLATGPVAVVSLMTATALEPLATAGSTEYIAYAILLSVLVGLFQFCLGVLRLGLVVNFLSHPVVSGFTNAAAIIIATSQLSKLFGVYVDKAEHHYETIYRVLATALTFTHWPTLAFATLSFTIMAVLRKVDRRIPNVLVAVVITTLISWAVGFDKSRTVSINQIPGEEVRQALWAYNSTVSQHEAKSEQKVILRSHLKEVRKNFGPNCAEAFNLEAQISTLQVEMDKLHEEGSDYRTILRAFRFENAEIPGAGLVYCLKGERPPELTGDGRTWRLRVGNNHLDETALQFMAGGAVVGTIPRGIPKIALPRPDFGVMLDLLTMAVIISLLGFMEAISIAKAMAAKTGQRLDPNQELIGQGLANMVGALNQSYPVSGSFSRSAVNLQAGAVTGLSNAFSSMVVVITLVFLTPLLYHLPQAVLASIIIMAVINLVNPAGFMHTWRVQKYDGYTAIITFVCTLAFAPHLDKGIMIGVVLSLGHFLFRNIKPDMAVLSRWTDGTYRNADVRNLSKCRHIAVIRFNNSLFFANVNYLEEKVLDPIASMPLLKHIHVVANGINELDASGEEILSQLIDRVREAGYDFSMSGLNDSVIETMKRTHLFEKLGEDHIYGNVANAVKSLHQKTHAHSDEERCPLLETVAVAAQKEE